VAQGGSTGSIAGTAKDTTGAVLPGVTVEASSPALIEKVRSVITDEQGNYKIIDLRPGTYTVTFTLPGFSIVKREGIELTTGFTANVNGELKVGSLEETVTVTGASPIVDVQNARTQSVFSREILDTIPSGKGPQALYALTLGATGTGTDVGGTSATNAQAMSVHGSIQSDQKYLLDGMSYNTTQLGGGQAYYYVVNPVGVQELTIQTDGFNAETETGGPQANSVPKDGGNRFSYYGVAQYANEHMAGNNISPELVARGVTAQSGIRKTDDYDAAAGGPIRRDKLWFYTSNRWTTSERYPVGSFTNASTNPLFFIPGVPTYSAQPIHDNGVRLTWQVSAKQKVTMSENYQDQHFYNPAVPGAAQAPAVTLATSTPTSENRWGPLHLAQATWSYPRTNRLLLDAGMSIGYFTRDSLPNAVVTPTTISVLELTTGLRYGASGSNLGSTGGYGTHKSAHNINQRAAMSYVTGSHAIKVGLQLQQGIQDDPTSINQSITYTFRSGVPISLTEYASPSVLNTRSRGVGLYGQDQWSVRRLTLSYGLRYDRLYGYTLPLDLPAGRFLPARHFDALSNVPDWNDISPRFGASYDLFGTGKTAVKASLGRYISGTNGGQAIANRLHPSSAIVTSATRTWTDRNGNLSPDCDFSILTANGECGAISDNAFGTLRQTTTISNDFLAGWDRRDYTWRWSAAVQQELRAGLGLNVGYFGTSYGNPTISENTAVLPSDFSQYCVTAPADSRLPGGGGNQLCGFYDVSPAKLGQVSTLISPAAKYGSVDQKFHAFDVSVSARLPHQVFVQGGVSTGVLNWNACVATDRPNVTLSVQNPSPPAGAAGAITIPNNTDFCQGRQPWSSLTQMKALVSYPIVWGLEASANYQNLPGAADSANYTVTSAQVAPSLGRNLSAGATATVTVPIIKPYTLFEARMSQLDLRFAKSVRVRGARIKGMFDIYNAGNAGTVLATNSTYGAAWLKPTSILAPRLFKIGAEISY
jgi:hypothetical protein